MATATTMGVLYTLVLFYCSLLSMVTHLSCHQILLASVTIPSDDLSVNYSPRDLTKYSLVD